MFWVSDAAEGFGLRGRGRGRLLTATKHEDEKPSPWFTPSCRKSISVFGMPCEMLRRSTVPCLSPSAHNSLHLLLSVRISVCRRLQVCDAPWGREMRYSIGTFGAPLSVPSLGITARGRDWACSRVLRGSIMGGDILRHTNNSRLSSRSCDRGIGWGSLG